jgi:hypothetical protein
MVDPRVVEAPSCRCRSCGELPQEHGVLQAPTGACARFRSRNGAVGNYSRESPVPVILLARCRYGHSRRQIVRRDLFDAEGLREVPGDVPDTDTFRLLPFPRRLRSH